MRLPNKTNPRCPHCNEISKKKGLRKSDKRTTQRYLCKQCNHSFTQQSNLQIHKIYNLKTILNTISNYNLGRPLRKNKIPSSTIHNWIKHINLPMHRLRNHITKNKTNPIVKHRFIHHRQPFLYQYHALKLDFARKFPELINYLKTINKSLPKHIFENSERISQVSRKLYKETPTTLVKTRVEREIPHKVGNFPFRVGFSQRKPVFEPNDVVGVSDKSIDSEPKQNYATKLANIALSITKDNKKRHDIIENFMLINDTATIATEIPIYLTENETKSTNLTGHIDILQARYHKLYILDYKPEPVNQQQTINQLKLYQKALSKRTNIKKHKFKLAFFNDKGYYEIN